jgi:hypothetical protein
MITIRLGSDESEHFRIASLEYFGDNSGWRGLLTMRSGSFAVINHTFYFDDLREFRDNVQIIYRDLAGTANLRPRYEEEYLEVSAMKRGHIKVKAHMAIYGDGTNRIDMEFHLDQTFLPELISSLEQAIKNKESEQDAALRMQE